MKILLLIIEHAGKRFSSVIMAQVSFVLVDYSTCQSDEGLGGDP